MNDGGSLSEARRAHLFLVSVATPKPQEVKTMAVQPVPEGYHTVTPYLAVDNAAEAIDFYRRAFGAKERVRMSGPGDTVMHAELEIGDSHVMLSDPFPQASTTPR